MNQMTTIHPGTDLVFPAERPELGIADYLDIIRRRFGVMLASAVAIFVITAIVALALPALYRSTAVILVEEQSIPEEFIKSTITTFADERIQVISQRVLTRTTLLQLVDKFDLYPSQRRSETNDEILERMRSDIRFTPISADRGRSGGKVTIAFNIAYVSESPQKAQRVVNELVSLFLNENVRVRQQRTAETSAFLGEESKRLATQLQEMEARLATFRARNANALPESSQVNSQLAERNESEIMRVDRELRMLEDRRSFLQAQLAITPPNLPSRELVTATGERVSAQDPAERLRALRLQQTTLSGSYSEAHPDMRRVAREITVLEREIKESGGSVGIDEAATKEVVALREKLRSARERYSDTHPDVLRLQKSLAALEQATTTQRPSGSAASTAAGKPRPDNPAYQQLVASIEQAVSESRALTSSRDEMRQRQRVYAARLESAPNVQREYLDLVRDYDNSLKQYRDIKGKELEAQVAEELEKDRKGERFSLLEPAQLPEKPFKPDRTAIILIGLALALGGGVGIGVVREAIDSSIKGPRDLARNVALPILAQVPYLPSVEDGERKRLQRWSFAAGTLLVIVAGLVLVHLFLTPIDTLIYRWL
jgi:succinoglycan biosynthesis transport protein ExoP